MTLESAFRSPFGSTRCPAGKDTEVAGVVVSRHRKLKADVLIAPLIAAEYLLLQRRIHEPNQIRQPLYIN